VFLIIFINVIYFIFNIKKNILLFVFLIIFTYIVHGKKKYLLMVNNTYKMQKANHF